MNEMDQLAQFRATVPPGVSPRAEERFRAGLQRELDAGRPGRGHDDTAPPRTGRRRRLLVIGGTAGVVTAAAATAVALVVAPSGSASPPGRSTARPAAAAPTRSAADRTSAPTVESPLTRLADYIAASTSRQPGDATLVVRTTTLPAGDPQAGTYRVYDLYTDSGPYYFGQTRSALAAQVAGQHPTGGETFANEVAAARYAVHGDLATARLRMAALSHSPVQGMSEALVKFKADELGVKPAPGQSLRDAVGQAMLDNYVWENSQDALVAGSGNPQVRAGVLRLLTTVSGITVTAGRTAGQPTLVVAEVTSMTTPAPVRGPRHFRYQEALTLNARTGIPLGFTGGIIGQRPGTTVVYQVSRVTLAAIAAGRF